MGEVVDMTGRVVVADEHPLGAESVRDVSVKDRELFNFFFILSFIAVIY